MIRLVATDLDGTLLGPDGRIPDANVAALRSAHAAGVRLAIATGRPTRWLDCLAPIADLHPYVIASNGAAVYDLTEGRVVLAHPFERPVLDEVVARTKAVLPETLLGLERGDLFGLEDGPDVRLHLDPDSTLRGPVDQLVDRIGAPVKVLVYSSSESSDDLVAVLLTAVGELATVTMSASGVDFGLAELSRPGVTKAHALDELAAQLGIAPADAVAFGDMPNDLAMLQWAGRGYVMADGHPSLLGLFPSAGTCADAGVGRVVTELLASGGDAAR